MKNICFLILLVIAFQARGQQKDHMISMEGLGSLKLGMSQAELEKLLNQKLLLDNHLDTINSPTWDTAKLKYKNIPVQLEFDKNYTAPYTFHWRLIGIRANSPSCKTISGIGVGSDKLKIITAFDNHYVHIQPGYANYFETEKGKGKSTISVSNDTRTNMIRMFLLNNKVVSIELKADIRDDLSQEASDENKPLP
jgi:hypothetical protein